MIVSILHITGHPGIDDDLQPRTSLMFNPASNRVLYMYPRLQPSSSVACLTLRVAFSLSQTKMTGIPFSFSTPKTFNLYFLATFEAGYFYHFILIGTSDFGNTAVVIYHPPPVVGGTGSIYIHPKELSSTHHHRRYNMDQGRVVSQQ